MTASHSGSGGPRRMDAGVLEPEIGSFRLYLAAEGKSPKTIRTYTDAARWFGAERLLGKAAGGEVVEGPAPAPNGTRLIARHPDGAVFEYIETGDAG